MYNDRCLTVSYCCSIVEGSTFLNVQKMYTSLIFTHYTTLTSLQKFYRFAFNAEQIKKKPGREVVTFLLVCNLAMWAIYSLETNRADSHPIQVVSLQSTFLFLKIKS